MNKRERVERTINLEETDRIPIYDLLRCDTAFEYFSDEKIPVLSKTPEVEEKLKEIVGKAVDNLLDMTRSVGFGPVVEEIREDESGIIFHVSPKEKTFWIEKRPFNDEKGAIEFIKKRIKKLENSTKEINSNRERFRNEYHKKFLETQKSIGDTVNLLAEQGTGLDDVRHSVGFELFSYIQHDQPGLISEFLEVCTNYNISVCHAIADRNLSPAVMTYGDIACKNRLLHSPEFLKKEFFPRLKKLNEAWHQHNIKCLFHSDGYLMEVMDDLIGCDIDGINPIETVAGMDLKKIKEKYGKKIFLTGGIDMSQLLSLREPDEVKEVCREAIEIAYPGYFIGSTTELDNSAKLENIIAMYEVAMEKMN